MTRYLVTFTRVDSFSVEVEADSHGEAMAAAYESDDYQNAPGLCAYCSGYNRPGPAVDAGEWEVDEQAVHRLDEAACVECGLSREDGAS